VGFGVDHEGDDLLHERAEPPGGLDVLHAVRRQTGRGLPRTCPASVTPRLLSGSI
jgi:hypothetical protein